MSRDFTSAEWADELLRPHRQQLEDLERRTEYIRQAAFREGLTAHLRGTSWSCPFCEEDVANLPTHLIICEEVPDHLREDLPEQERAPGSAYDPGARGEEHHP